MMPLDVIVLNLGETKEFQRDSERIKRLEERFPGSLKARVFNTTDKAEAQQFFCLETDVLHVLHVMAHGDGEGLWSSPRKKPPPYLLHRRELAELDVRAGVIVGDYCYGPPFEFQLTPTYISCNRLLGFAEARKFTTMLYGRLAELAQGSSADPSACLLKERRARVTSWGFTAHQRAVEDWRAREGLVLLPPMLIQGAAS